MPALIESTLFCRAFDCCIKTTGLEMGAIPAGMNQQKIDLHDSISTRKEHSAVYVKTAY